MRRRSDSNNKLLYDPNQRMQQRLGTFSMDENSEEEIDDEEVKSDVEDFRESNENYENGQNSSSGNNDENYNQGLVKNVTKIGAQQLRNQVKNVVGNVARKVALKIGAFIAANPWVLLIIGGAAALFLLIIQ